MVAGLIREGGYAALVAARLLELRVAGERDFEAAWETTMLELPPKFTWSRRYIRGEESAVELLRRRCALEWAGEGGFGVLVPWTD